jgi:RNA polymerase sigma-70 factor (ECF subfamily)
LDEAVVRLAQSGDHEAFGKIVDESIDRLFALATLMTRDSTLAEDAVQDALVRAWRDLPRLRDPSKCTAWLTRLTVNATYDVLRRYRRVRETRPLDESQPATADEAGATLDRASLSWAYGHLPIEQRSVVILHYYLGLSLDEAAATLGIPRGTVRSRLNAGLTTMRRLLNAKPGSSPSNEAQAAR